MSAYGVEEVGEGFIRAGEGWGSRTGRENGSGDVDGRTDGNGWRKDEEKKEKQQREQRLSCQLGALEAIKAPLGGISMGASHGIEYQLRRWLWRRFWEALRIVLRILSVMTQMPLPRKPHRSDPGIQIQSPVQIQIQFHIQP